ncbi:hypothetical protein XENTR_v10003231 [Xenopus tropicalis]|nr:hypothetical protein XENTR_v10003231 [Xenopus tropicalis]
MFRLYLVRFLLLLCLVPLHLGAALECLTTYPTQAHIIPAGLQYKLCVTFQSKTNPNAEVQVFGVCAGNKLCTLGESATIMTCCETNNCIKEQRILVGSKTKTRMIMRCPDPSGCKLIGRNISTGTCCSVENCIFFLQPIDL